MQGKALCRGGSRFGLAALLLGLAGCGEETERTSEVVTLRVLAVRAETPFAQPGSEVPLSMLFWDGSPHARHADGTARPITTLWLGGCTNPPGDNPYACLPFVQRALGELGDEALAAEQPPPEWPAGLVGWGSTFTAVLPPDIIGSRPLAPGVVYPYGLEVVFFAACAGQLRRLEVDDAFPLACFDPDTGERLGRDDFDFGYYSLFAYESLQNENPPLLGVMFRGLEPGPECSVDAPCAEGSHCGSSGQCLPVVPRCTASDEDDCTPYSLAIDVPRSAAEPAVMAHVPVADAKAESVWVTYYSSAGSWEKEARTINDARSGWGEKIGGKWRANAPSGTEAKLWAVVRDNRNGVSWAERAVWVE